MKSSFPKVSVIIPVFNDKQRLEKCLEALENQTYPKDCYQIVVVDNASTVDLKSTVMQFQQARLYYEEKPGSYAARNKGLSVATGEIIAFTDSSSDLNTLAFPLYFSISGATATCLTIQPSGAIFPVNTASPPSLCTGLLTFRITDVSTISHLSTFLAIVLPVTVIQFPWISPIFKSSFVTAGIPPALSKSSMWCGPAGASLHRFGVFLDILSNISSLGN